MLHDICFRATLKNGYEKEFSVKSLVFGKDKDNGIDQPDWSTYWAAAWMNIFQWNDRNIQGLLEAGCEQHGWTFNSYQLVED